MEQSAPSAADRVAGLRRTFHDLHAADELFVMPNPFDVGSAKLLVAAGFRALATTSSGFAATLGKHDGAATFDELIAHVAAITAAVDVPVNVDSERLFAETLDGLATSVDRLAEAGASGCSIEDWNPGTGAIDDLDLATERVAAAAAAANRHGIALTARAEAHLHGPAELDTTIARLQAFRDAGAHCLYAPGLSAVEDIARVVDEVAAPINILALPAAPSVPELAAVGVRRISTGGALAWAAFGAVVHAAEELLGPGTSTYWSANLTRAQRGAFD
jgi:2-methylisocitrate lyase-like PEP mutase family enzyme